MGKILAIEYIIIETERIVSRIIQTEGVGKERNRLLKAIVISIRELMKQNVVDSNTRDLAAFISNALLAVHDTVERTVAPWEKRDYWVKADKFRMEWAWTKDSRGADAGQLRELRIGGM